MTESDYQLEASNTPTDFPWPPPENGSVLEALATTWKESVFHPTSFFRRMPREFDFGWVIGYYLIIGVVAAGIGLFWHMVLGPSLFERLVMQETGEPSNPIVDFLLSPLVMLIALFVGAGIIHLFVLMFGGRRYGFGTTARVFSFAIGPALFEIVPFLGGPVGGVWTLVLTIIGLREAHELTTGRAAAAVLIPMFFLLLLAGLLMLVALAVGATQMPV